MTLKPGKRHIMRVSFELNANVSLNELKDFIANALETMGGCRHPDDPLFGSLEKVRVSWQSK